MNLNHDDDEPLDSLPLMQHCLGSLVYSLVFGVKYEQEDPLWKWLQHLQEEGTKLIGVAGPMNFLPWLRSALETSPQNGTLTHNQNVNLGSFPSSGTR
jgi:hypothetical protein